MTRQEQLAQAYRVSVAQAASFAELSQAESRWNSGGTDVAFILWCTEQMEKEEEKQIQLAGMLDKLPAREYVH